MAERLVGNVDSVASAVYLIPTSRGDARWIADRFQRIQESDMMAWPDASTAQVLPFHPGGSRAMRMFAEIRTLDTKSYIADPRVILSQNLGRLEGLGFSHMNVGPEAEHFYFQDETGPGLLDNAGHFDVNPAD